jgi:type II restriction enzyme
LKSQDHPLGAKIVDAAFVAMKRKIETEGAPNLVALHYARDAWRVRTVVLVPSFAFTLSLLEKRAPLGAKARRAGWVGCNILLRNVPPDARVFVVHEGEVLSKSAVRTAYRRLRPLRNLCQEKRGWTLDVLNMLRELDRKEFELAAVYAFDRRLSKLHPQNRHVRPKIRQQLQILRNLGFVKFLGGGHYRLL